MKILVTGAAGFVGRNLVENLKNIRDGKNRTRPNLVVDEVFRCNERILTAVGQKAQIGGERLCKRKGRFLHEDCPRQGQRCF